MRGASILVLAFLCTVVAAHDIRFFVHIPKTGGTTFRHIFAADCGKTWTFFADSPGNLSDAFFVIDLIKHNNYTCFQGHMEWEMVAHVREALKDRNLTTFVLLREPKARLVSQYYYEQAIHNKSYTPVDFFEANANLVSRYLGSNAAGVIEKQADFVGITEYYHETLSYLVVAGFLRNRDDVVNYNTRKVHRTSMPMNMLMLAEKYVEEDNILYQKAMQRFTMSELMSVSGNEQYETTLADLNNRTHECKNDAEGIGSGYCRYK